MNDRHDDVMGEPEGIHGTARPGSAEEGQQTERLFRQLLEDSVAAERMYPEILRHCHLQGISERELRRRLAIYRQTGSLSSAEPLPSQELAGCNDEKLRARTLALIGSLPPESLDDFGGLLAFTATFLARVQFVCDLVMYLFAEREKGARRQGSDGRLYTQFLAQKLMWELDVVCRIAEQRPLAELNDQYFDWLTDRILDGEVLI
jgi:hypothetical protein